MKAILGIVMMILGIALGLYVGVWLLFIGGIAGLVNIVASAINGGGIEGLSIAINIGKIVFAGVTGILSAAILFFPGVTLLVKS